MNDTARRPITVLDTHVHFWDVDELDYPWLAAEPTLNRTWVPSDLLAESHIRGDHTVRGVIFVQADCAWPDAMREVDWVTGLAENGAPIVGAVAAVPLELGSSCAQQINRLAANPLVVGVRRLLQDMPPGFALADSFVEAVQMLGDADLTFDICIREHQLPEAVALVERCPDVTFVLDHLGKPRLSPEHWVPWADGLTALSEFPNVYCKLSGLPGEVAGGEADLVTFTAYLQLALEVFGPQRCMFGSDWPVSALDFSYADWVGVVDHVLDLCTEQERAAVWSGTARRVYTLNVATEEV